MLRSAPSHRTHSIYPVPNVLVLLSGNEGQCFPCFQQVVLQGSVGVGRSTSDDFHRL